MRLNIALYAAIVIFACMAVLVAIALKSELDSRVDGVDVVPGAGQDVGRGIVQAVPLAKDAEQERVAAQLEAATKMVNAFMNFSYKEPDATIKSVQSMSTGDFLKEYNKGVSGLRKLAGEAQSSMVAEVVWAGLVAGDNDSATVIVATSGTVTNKTTEFKEEARNYRIQVELALVKDRWLTRDLQYVQLG
ncbi:MULTISPECIES: hypothetical protein [unclassified Nocardioides]|uniref:hypothetical protein n=1 Tax=unclassified Nocardioides TaxID=2615069 RepID=UPI0012E371C4|nr:MULTISPECIES: hypothetical protein [unclassified Nocardioides]